jgi:hypothetical protein
MLFIGLDVVYTHTENLSSMYSLERDRGYAEIYQYLKFAWILLILGALTWKLRALVYASWFIVFAYLLIDDALLFHEIFGLYAAEKLLINPGFSLRGQDFGELLVTVIAGLTLFIFVAFAYTRSNPDQRLFTRRMTILVLYLAFFGVLFDSIHEMLRGTILFNVFGTIEDGGELIVASVMSWFVTRTYLFEVS